MTVYEHKTRVKAQELGQAAYESLRSATIRGLPQQMMDFILNNPVPRLEIVDILEMVRVEFQLIVPSTEIDAMLARLVKPLQPTETVQAAINEFTQQLQYIPEDRRPRNHLVVAAFTSKLSGAERHAVDTQLRAQYPTDQTRLWNAVTQAMIASQILGAREHSLTSPFAAAATLAPTAAPPAIGPPKYLAYCFKHGQGYHPSITCTSMLTDYGPYDPSNEHALKFQCFTGGRNINGVVSSSAVTTPRQPSDRNRGGRGRESGRGGGRGGGRAQG